MALTLTVRDAIDLGILDKLTLVAGSGGLDREITKAGILEYEIITGNYGSFIKGELIMTSLMQAYNDESLLLKVFGELNRIGVSGVAVKTILFSELPPAVLEFAQQAGLPVFTFDDDVYYEDIILPIAHKTNVYRDYNYREQLIEELLQNRGDPDKLTEALNIANLKRPVCMVFRSKTALVDKKSIVALWESPKIKSLFAPGSVGVAFQNGFLILLGDAPPDGYPRSYYHGVVNSMGVNKANYHIGVSSPHPIGEVLQCIREGYFAAKVALLLEREMCLIAETGSYQILMQRDEFNVFQSFSRSMLEPLIQYDAKTGGNLYETAISYVCKNGQLKDTASDLFQHINTIRYRINKMKSLLHYKDSDYVFYADISLAVRIHLLQQIP